MRTGVITGTAAVAGAPGVGAARVADLERWRGADATARPRRVAALRASLEAAGLDAYFGVRPENARYLTGFVLGDGEEKVSGASGRFFVGADQTVVLADSRYRLQALEECPDSRVQELPTDIVAAWPEVVASLHAIAARDGQVRRIGV
ncbi:MAG TPA: aminopeptidase P family N-terminal domain-containing protein, partial [Vicinamibacteria bacterium]